MKTLNCLVIVCALTVASAPARADVVTDWNQIAIRATDIAGVPVPVQTRVLALVHAAVFDAVNSVEGKYEPFALAAAAPAGASPVAAAAGAAHGVLVSLFPMQKAISDAALAASLSALPEGASTRQGVEFGHEIARKIISLRESDGATRQVAYAFRSGAGRYQATPPMNAMPILPQWGDVKPFVIGDAENFKFAGPPALDSRFASNDLDEVRRLGGRDSRERTNEQTAIAIHWAGSEVPPLNAVARAASAAKAASLSENARLFALLNMAMADSLVAGFRAKYTFDHWRPVTVIRGSGNS